MPTQGLVTLLISVMMMPDVKLTGGALDAPKPEK